MPADSTPKHRVFVSYDHAHDQIYRDWFERLLRDYPDIRIAPSAGMGDISPGLGPEAVQQTIRDEHLRDTTLTVVLIGIETWKLRQVDWEIGASLRKVGQHPGSGLLGLILPEYRRRDLEKYNQYTIPPRLYDNIRCEYAIIHNWSENPEDVRDWLEIASDRRETVPPDNSRESFAEDKIGFRWFG